jgi:lysophospholipase L1-like esterase
MPFTRCTATIGLFLVLATLGDRPAYSQPPAAALPKVVLLGDSIRLGYAPYVEKALAGQATVISPKPNGGDSSRLLTNLAEWAIREEPTIVHFNCGIHDIKKSKTTGSFQIPPDQYEANLRAIVERLRKETNALVVFASTTPIDDVRAATTRQSADYELLGGSVRQYNEIVRRVMHELNVPVNDLRAALGDAEQQTTLLRDDGIHFTSVGYEKLGQAVAAEIRKQLEQQTRPQSWDLVIYGGTSAAVTAAVQAKKMGKSVVIVCPDKHLGGLSSGGLGWTDTGNKAVIGGLAREFYHRVWQHYEQPSAWKWQAKDQYGNTGQGTPAIDGAQRTMWIFEPHVAEQVFEDLVNEHQIPVYRDEWLDGGAGVTKTGPRLTAVRLLSGKQFAGKMFIDATYEGDLLAAAGIDYTVGREANSTYREEYNGVQTGVLHHRHHFGVLKEKISPYLVPGDPKSGLLPRVSSQPPGEFGAADKRLQAYCYRICLTDHPDNRVEFPKPTGYDAKQYELLLRVFAAGWRETFEKFDPIPNHKTDTNNHGPFSTDNIGYNYDYPEASYERRREILREHQQYQQGWLYFIANDPRVPHDVQQAMRRWGLAKDEFTDNGNWPHQIYVREARRMIGSFVMTENELRKKKPTPDSVGMGSYTIDSHNVQRYITPEGYVQNEGDIGVSTSGPYQIAYGSLVPKKAQCENLLVPVCLSSSHIAFGSIRMEPVFMILGQSAAAAAVLAIDDQQAVQDVPYAKLRQRLLANGQVLESISATPAADEGKKRAAIDWRKLPGIIIDDSDAKLTGNWKASHAAAAWIGEGYQHDQDARDGQASARFEAKLPSTGRYEVRFAYTPNPNRSTRTAAVIVHANGQESVTINQRQPPPLDGNFTSLGVFPFTADKPASVTISNRNSDGYVIIDAVQFVPASEKN